MVIRALSDLRPGERGTITRIGNKGVFRHRIMDMGVVPGAEIEMVRVAPLGDPVEFRIKGYNLSLRKGDAKEVEVESKMIPLSMVSPGEEGRLVAIYGGQRLRKRLADLGLNLGTTLKVVQAGMIGPLIVAVNDSRLVLGRGMAHKIMVEPL
jgi:ferrous iron transport protein A